MPRNSQVVRQWFLLQTLQSAPKTVPELARDLGTTPRTVYRDLEALQALPFAFYTERHDDGATRWHLLRSAGGAR